MPFFGRVSKQLTNLETARLIEIRKEFVDKKSRTIVSLTGLGRRKFKAYWQTMEQLRAPNLAMLRPQEG